MKNKASCKHAKTFRLHYVNNASNASLMNFLLTFLYQSSNSESLIHPDSYDSLISESPFVNSSLSSTEMILLAAPSRALTLAAVRDDEVNAPSIGMPEDVASWKISGGKLSSIGNPSDVENLDGKTLLVSFRGFGFPALTFGVSVQNCKIGYRCTHGEAWRHQH